MMDKKPDAEVQSNHDAQEPPPQFIGDLRKTGFNFEPKVTFNLLSPQKSQDERAANNESKMSSNSKLIAEIDRDVMGAGTPENEIMAKQSSLDSDDKPIPSQFKMSIQYPKIAEDDGKGTTLVGIPTAQTGRLNVPVGDESEAEIYEGSRVLEAVMQQTEAQMDIFLRKYYERLGQKKFTYNDRIYMQVCTVGLVAPS